MKIIEPNVELWSEEGVSSKQHIARCARVCYGHDGEGRDPSKLVKTLIGSGHTSMLRHASQYFVYKNVKYDDTPAEMDICPYNTTVLFNKEGGYRENTIWLSTNCQESLFSDNFTYDADPENMITFAGLLEHCRIQPELFDIVRLTFCITTQIATSRELNRVSPNNIAERSTRYCSSKEGLEICKPWWWEKAAEEDPAPETPDWDYATFHWPEKQRIFELAWNDAEKAYQDALNADMKPEDARGLLPLDTATKVVYTYSVRQWKHILDLRYYEKTGKAHPNVKLIMGMVRDQINQFAKEHGIVSEV